MDRIFKLPFSMTRVVSQDRERCQFPFVLDEKPAFVPVSPSRPRNRGNMPFSAKTSTPTVGKSRRSHRGNKRWVMWEDFPSKDLREQARKVGLYLEVWEKEVSPPVVIALDLAAWRA
jgi:hypothetical protein